MKKSRTILLVEDDDNDVFLMKTAFERMDFRPRIIVLHNGEEAIQYLKGAGTYADRRRFPWPCLMLLDLKMPLVTGFDVLAWVQEQPELPELPIIILSSSNLENDIARAKELGAFSYYVKSADPNYYAVLANRIREHCRRESRTGLCRS